jgi:hypothetical protein
VKCRGRAYFERVENWFLRITQMLVVFGVSGTAAAYQVTTNGTLIGAWGIIAAIAWTMLYGKIADWVIERRIAQREEHE